MATKSDKSFENSLKQLEQVVAKLEAGNLSLDESIKLYEKGVKLNQLCEQQLKEAAGKIEHLKKSLEKSS